MNDTPTELPSFEDMSKLFAWVFFFWLIIPIMAVYGVYKIFFEGVNVYQDIGDGDWILTKKLDITHAQKEN